VNLSISDSAVLFDHNVDTLMITVDAAKTIEFVVQIGLDPEL
jgi:hypothetical protein